MAKRSDFAQKLLDDLRLRKERMASSQSSKGSNSLNGGDAYGYSRHAQRGSRNMKAQASTGYRSSNPQIRSSGGKKLLTNQEAVNQIVPYGRGQSSGGQIGDLSMALAFAFENGGKLRVMDSGGSGSVLGFLKQFGRKPMDYGKIENRSGIDIRTSSSRFPTLTHLQIKEISKGAQKLNQILRACSTNGINFDSYSIEIGKELLKGAMDLEESLRMLVNLEEASDHMIAPQRKNRITLLDEDEDEDDNTTQSMEQKQLDLPRFSFDKHSRNYRNIKESARTGMQQRVMALTYSSEAPNSNQGNQVLITSNSVSHRRSNSYASQMSNFVTFSDQKSRAISSQSKSEKARIPNVVAKLMGLDDLPASVDSKHFASQKDANSRPKNEGVVSKKAAQTSTKKTEKRTKDAEVMVPSPVKQKVIKTDKLPVVHNATLDLLAERNLPARNGNLEAAFHDRKPPWKEFEGTKPVTGSRKAMADMEKQQSYVSQFIGSNASQKDVQDKERRQDNSKHSEQKGTKKGEFIEMDHLQQVSKQTHKRFETAAFVKEKSRSKESTPQTEKRYSNKHLLGSQQKLPNDLRMQQPRMQQKFEPQKEFHQAEEREQLRKQKGSEAVSNDISEPLYDAVNLEMRQPPMNHIPVGKKTSTVVISEMQSEKFPNGRNHENLTTDGRSIGYSQYLNSSPHSSLREVETEPAKAKKGVPPAMEEKMVQVPVAQNTRNTKVHKTETPRRIDEVVTRKKGTLQSMIRPPKQRSTNLQQVRQRMRDKLNGSKDAEKLIVSRSKDAEARIVKSTNSVAGIPQLNVIQQSKKEADKALTLYTPVENECQLLEEPQALARNDSIQDIISKVTGDKQGQAPKFCRDEEFKSSKTASNPHNGFHKESKDISYTFQLKHDKYSSKSQTPEPLTESEIHLKRVLIQSQLFLNTAEALFKLNIPVAILQANGHDCHDQESKLILDCGYEVMRRKGRKQELSVHPYTKASTTAITSVKIRSLDDLVKQLNREFEKLKLYGRNGNAQCLLEDYLPKMLESDVYNKEADVNCMWDFGWDEMMFAFIEKDEVVKDLEKILLNGLIDEITRDLVLLCM